MPPKTHPLRRPPLALALLAGLAPAAQAADGIVLNPVVVTGSRAEAASFELPWSVDVIPAQRIHEGQLGVNASETLASVPGLVVQNRQNYAQDLQISVRGFGARAAFGVRGVKLIADGIPASTPDGQGQAATFNLDTAERIEVLRGPFATIYGNHSGGVIQLFSRDGSGPPTLRGGLMAGSFGSTKLSLGAEGQQGGVGYVLDASRFDTDGYRDHSAATRDQAFAKLTLQPDQDSRLTLIASGLRQDGTEDPLGLGWAAWKADPRSVDPVAREFDTRKDIHHMQGGATYSRKFGRDRLEVQAYGGNRSVTQYQSIPPSVQARPSHSGGVVDFERDFMGLGARWIAQRELGGGELTLTAGLDYDRSEDDRQGYENFIGSTLGVKGALRRDETDTVTSTDPYVQGIWRRGDWQFSAGLRHSRVEFEVDDGFLGNGDDSGEVSYSKTTPALGLSWALNPALNLYASVARGFETPTLNELSYAPSGDGFNFALQPSRSLQYELGAKALLGDSSRVNAALFHIRTEDELVVAASSGGRTSYTNAGETLRQGLELLAESELSPQWSALGALTWMRAVYDDSFSSRGETVPEGRRIPGVPALAAYGELAWRPAAGLSAAVEGVYRSKLYVEDQNKERAAPGYALLNLRFTAEQRQGAWTFSEMLRVDNLFDREYLGSVIVGDSNGRFYEPGPGRAWYAGVQARYSFH